MSQKNPQKFKKTKFGQEIKFRTTKPFIAKTFGKSQKPQFSPKSASFRQTQHKG